MLTPIGRLITGFADRLVLDDLEVHPAATPRGGIGGLGLLPTYVPRELDEPLDGAVAAAARGQSNIVVLVGDSSTGKTRSCWEAVRKMPDDWRPRHPIEPDRTTAFTTQLDQVGPRTVV